MKYTVKCVNNGEPFDMPAWTIEKHEKALARLAADQKKEKWSEEKASSQFKYYVIYETMLELDPNCDFKELKNFLKHPITLTQLFNAVYEAGKENIYYVENFRKGRKTQKRKKSKSTGKKN